MALVSDSSRRGIQAVGRIARMIGDLNLNPTRMGLIVNRAPGGTLNPGVRDEIEKQGLHLIGVLPQDDAVFEADCEGKPSSKISEADSPMKKALHTVLDSIGL